MKFAKTLLLIFLLPAFCYSAQNDNERLDNNQRIIEEAQEGNFEKVKELLDSGEVDINAIAYKGGNTALIASLMNNHVNVARLLLNDNSVDINICNNNGLSALMVAIVSNSTKKNDIYPTVKLLLDHGIDINIIDVHGLKAFDYARCIGNPKIIELLNCYINEYLPYRQKQYNEKVLSKLNDNTPLPKDLSKIVIDYAQFKVGDKMVCGYCETFSEFLEKRKKTITQEVNSIFPNNNNIADIINGYAGL